MARDPVIQWESGIPSGVDQNELLSTVDGCMQRLASARTVLVKIRDGLLSPDFYLPALTQLGETSNVLHTHVAEMHTRVIDWRVKKLSPLTRDGGSIPSASAI